MPYSPFSRSLLSSCRPLRSSPFVITFPTFLVLSAMLGRFVPRSEAQQPVTCHGLVATLVGTAGKDTLTGTNANDVIVGLGGNDVISGGNGNDVSYVAATGEIPSAAAMATMSFWGNPATTYSMARMATTCSAAVRDSIPSMAAMAQTLWTVA